MKKRTHKILSWVLTIAMVLGMLPAMSLPAEAADPISEINITVTEPVAGEAPDENCTITDGVYVDRVDWMNASRGGYAGSTFAANTKYQVVFTLLGTFTSDVSATVNGNPADEIYSEYDDIEGGVYWYVTYTFDATEGEGINVSRSSIIETASGDGWTWNTSSGKLTLDGYAGGPIYIGGFTAGDVEIELLNTNSATVSQATGDSYCAGIEVMNANTVTFTGSGTLSVNVTTEDSNIVSAYGIYLNNSYGTGDVMFRNGTTVRVTSTKQTTGVGMTFGIYTDGSSGDVTVEEGATLRVYPTSNDSRRQTTGIYSVCSGDVTMNGTVQINQIYSGSNTPSTSWSSVFANTITIGANADVDVMMPFARTHGLDYALLAANGNTAVKDCSWTKVTTTGKSFQNDSCLLILSAEEGADIYYRLQYKKVDPMTFTHLDAYDVPEGTAGTAWTAETALSASVGGGSGKFTYEIVSGPEDLSINSANKLVYARPAAAQAATTATVRATDAEGGLTRDIEIAIGAVTEAAVSEGITITGSTPTQNHATWSYVKDTNTKTNTLTLNGYQGGGISASGMSTLTLVLEGTNVINGDVGGFATGIDCLCNLTIKGSGSLTINSIQTETSKHARAVSAYTITQNGGNVTVNVESVYYHHALRAQTGIYLNGGKLTVNATDKNPSANGGSQLVYTYTREILVGEDAELTVNMTNNSRDCSDIAVYNAASATTDPTNNGDITIRGKVTITRTKDSHSTGGAVNGIITASTEKNTDGVITISDGADVTITDTEYAIVSNAPEAESQSDIVITGGTVNITSGISGSVGLRSKCNGISITGGTVNVSTDSVTLDLDSGYNENGIIRIGGSAVVNLTSDNSYAVKTCDTASSARVHQMDFSDSGSFTAKSNESSYQSYPVQAYFQLGTNTHLSEGIESRYNDAGTGRMFSSGTLKRVKVSYKQANAHPDCGAVKVNGCYFDVSTLYYKNGASDTYGGADGDWNAHYDPTTGVLELKNYAGGPIEIGGANPTVVELKLTGANTITANQPNIATGNYCAGVKIANADTVTVTGDGSLTVNVNAGEGIQLAYGIYLYSTSNAQSDLTIQSGTVDLNVDYTGSTSSTTHAVGIYTGETGNKSGKVTVGAGAAVHAAVTSGQSGSFAKGIWAKGDVALNGETSLRLTYPGTGAPNSGWTSVTTNGSITIGDGASVSVDMPTGRSYGLSSALLAAAENKKVDEVRWLINSSVYKTSENENFRMVATDGSGSLYADFDYMSKSGATAVEGITVTAADTALSANGTTTVTAAVTPEDATYPGVLWSSGNPNVTVDTYGNVTAGLEVQTNPGKAVLTATSKYDTSVTGSTAVTVGTLDSSKIYEVFAQVPAPVVGETPATDAEVTVDAGFSVQNVIWRCRADEKSDWGSLSGDTFKEGMLYQVEVDIQERSDTKDYPKDSRGNYAAGLMAAYINGKAVPVTSIYGSTDYKIASVYCTFGKAAADSSGGVKPDANFVTIDGGKPFAAPNQLCFKNGGAATTTDSSSYNAKYDPSTGVLELRNYNGGPIEIGGSVEADITIKLVGANVIASSGQFGIVNHHGGDITITADSDATLTINVTSDAMEAIGIACDRTESYSGCSRAITIGGKARVTVNATSTDTRDRKTAAGLRTPGTVTIRDGASFQAVCKSATPSIGVQAGVGILAYRGVTIDTTGTVEIDVSDSTSIGTFAIYGSAANALTKVGSMTLKWKQSGVDGGMLYPAGSFDSAAATHAVNVDTPNRVATYRSGTPYTVTVNNGSCDAVGRQYLEGDTVTVKARTIEGLEFTKWTSKDVTIADATSPTATFTMPAQDVTVTADFGAFTVQPVFTLTGEGTGTISFTLAKLPSDAPKLVEKDSDTVVGNQHFYGDELSRSLTVKDGTGPYHVRAGEYRIAVSYNGTWLYSDVFAVSYAGTPQATVSNQTVSGTRNETLNSVEVNISLTFDTFQSVVEGDNVGSWFTNLPAGLTAVINFVSSDMKFVSITISGTPTKAKNEAMAITIPGGKLASGADLTVTANPNAKFEITESPYVLTAMSATVTGPMPFVNCYNGNGLTVTSGESAKYSAALDVDYFERVGGLPIASDQIPKPGETFKVQVKFVPQGKYFIDEETADSMSVTINGKAADCGGVVSSGGILQYVSYYVLETVPAYTFDHIAFDIDPAAAGNTPDMTATVTDGDPGSKLASAVAWTDLGTTGTGTTDMTASSKFQGGHYYECRVTFTLSETTNYHFPGVGGMTITANGTEIPETADPNATQTSCFKRVSEGTTVKYIVYLRSELPEEGKLGLSSITREGGTIKYTILHNDTVPSTTVYVFAAQYKDGQLVDVKQSAKITVNGSDENGEFTGFTHAEGCTYKLFLLENGKYVPLCNAADIP